MVSVNLPPEIEKRLHDAVSKGLYPSVESAVEVMVRHYVEIGAFPYTLPPDLDRLIAEGMEDIERGDLLDGEAVFEELRLHSLRMRGKLP